MCNALEQKDHWLELSSQRTLAVLIPSRVRVLINRERCQSSIESNCNRRRCKRRAFSLTSREAVRKGSITSPGEAHRWCYLKYLAPTSIDHRQYVEVPIGNYLDGTKAVPIASMVALSADKFCWSIFTSRCYLVTYRFIFFYFLID